MYFQGVENFRQMKLQYYSELKKKQNETADFVVVLHVCKRKDINGSRFMVAYENQALC